MAVATLYEALKAAGCEIDHHEADLYVKATPEARAIIKANVGTYAQVSTFTNQRDGATWIEIPFHYDPFWHAAIARARGEG